MDDLEKIVIKIYPLNFIGKCTTFLVSKKICIKILELLKKTDIYH